MKFELLLSLQETASFKICAALWSRWVDQPRITSCNENCPGDSERGGSYLAIEHEIKAKIPELGLPSSLEKVVTRFVKPTGVEILKWCEFHCSGGCFDINMPKKFCWTSQGTIDLKRTAEVLVRDENLSLDIRHKLARIYCLEDDILHLSSGCMYIPNDSEKNKQAAHLELMEFWNPSVPDNQPERMGCSAYVHAFLRAALCGNIEAVIYFWKKLTPTEKKQHARNCFAKVLFTHRFYKRSTSTFPKGYYVKILWFLLSQLSVEDQMAVIKSYSSELVPCFMNWPYHICLPEVVKHIPSSISPIAWTCLLLKIVDRVLEGHEYYDYSELLTKVWQLVPKYCKQEVVRDHFGQLMTRILYIKDVKNIRLILGDIDPVEEKDFFYSFVKSICFRLIPNDDWDLLELFIRECIPFQKDMAEFKEKLTAPVKLHDAYDQFANLLDSLISEYHKRKCVEENYDETCKKLAGEQDEAVPKA